MPGSFCPTAKLNRRHPQESGGVADLPRRPPNVLINLLHRQPTLKPYHLPKQGIGAPQQVLRSQMPHTAPPPDRLSETTDNLLATAERCRRLSTWIIDRRASEALLQLAGECEAQVEELRQHGET